MRVQGCKKLFFSSLTGQEKATVRVTACGRKCFDLNFLQEGNFYWNLLFTKQQRSKALWSIMEQAVLVFRNVIVYYEPLAFRWFFGRRKKKVFFMPCGLEPRMEHYFTFLFRHCPISYQILHFYSNLTKLNVFICFKDKSPFSLVCGTTKPFNRCSQK